MRTVGLLVGGKIASKAEPNEQKAKGSASRSKERSKNRQHKAPEAVEAPEAEESPEGEGE